MSMSFLQKLFEIFGARREDSIELSINEVEVPSVTSSIQFDDVPGQFSGNEVGVVYIVSNDHHAEHKLYLRDHGKDVRNMKKFFGICDNFYIADERCVTLKRFLAACKYLAEYQDYPPHCDKIIIYFSGHGGRGKNGDGYILTEQDNSNPRNPSKITIEQVLEIFRGNINMSRILLIDACCSAENVNLEKDELVACAGSDSCNAFSLPDTGGFWTDELCKEFDCMQTYEINELLHSVEVKMKEKLYRVRPGSTPSAYKHLYPSYKSRLRKELVFRKKSHDPFPTFLKKIFDALKTQDFMKVRKRCSTYFSATAETLDIAEKVNETTNLRELFDVMSDHKLYWNWMQIQVIKKMAEDSEEAKKLIHQYESDVFSRKVKDCKLEISDSEVPKDKHTEVIVKLNKFFDILTLEDVHKHCSELENLLNGRGTMLLKNITGGCVEICWLLPNSLVGCAVKLAQSEYKSATNYQKIFSELLFFKIGDVIIMDSITNDAKKYGELIKKYEILLDKLQEVFLENDFPVNRLIRSFQVADTNQLSLFSDPVISEKVKSIKDLFTMIRKAFTFCDYRFLEIVVKISQFEEAIKLMDEYVTEVEDESILYISCKPEFVREECKPSSKLQLELDIDIMSTKKFNIVTHGVTYIFDLPLGSIILKKSEICNVILVYEISQKVKEYLINLTFSANKLKILSLMKIKSFVIDEVELEVSSNCDTKDEVSWTYKVTTKAVAVTSSTNNDCNMQSKQNSTISPCKAYDKLILDLKEVLKNTHCLQAIKYLLAYDRRKVTYFSSLEFQSIKDLLDCFANDCKYFSYTILKTFVYECKCKEAKTLMDRYIKEVDKILITGLNLQVEYKNVQSKYEKSTKRFTVVCGKKERFIKELNFIVETLEDCLKLPQGSISVEDVIHDCSILVCRISWNVQMPLKISTSKLKSLSEKMVESIVDDENMKELKIPLDCYTECDISWTKHTRVTMDAVKETASTKSDYCVDIPEKVKMLTLSELEPEESYDVEENVEMKPLAVSESDDDTDSREISSAQFPAKQIDDVELNSPEEPIVIMNTPAQETRPHHYKTDPVEAFHDQNNVSYNIIPHTLPWEYTSSASIPVAA